MRIVWCVLVTLGLVLLLLGLPGCGSILPYTRVDPATSASSDEHSVIKGGQDTGSSTRIQIKHPAPQPASVATPAVPATPATPIPPSAPVEPEHKTRIIVR